MKPLIDTNPYLKDPETRRRLIARSVRTSGGVEGIYIKGSSLTNLKIPRIKKKRLEKLLLKRTPQAK